MIKIPGLIDIHTHLRTPGQIQKENFLSGSSAALAGGFTTILDMPNNTVPITSESLLSEKIEIAKAQAISNIGFYFGSLGNNLSEFEKVKNRVFGLKLYLNETTGNFLINKDTLKEIYKAWPKDAGPILVHAEDDAIHTVIENVRLTHKRTHFCHISLESDLSQIINAKEEGLPITCGVTPHHLFLTKKDAEKLGAYGKMKPYLKSDKDIEFLWSNLSDIDVIESDHAPHTKEEKEKSENPPFGVPGLETTLPLLLTAIHENKLTIEDVLRLCHDNPKKIFNIPEDDYKVEIDLDETYVIKNEELFTKCGWSPFQGHQMHGRVKKVTLKGIAVFENGKITATPGSGRVITPEV